MVLVNSDCVGFTENCSCISSTSYVLVERISPILKNAIQEK